MFTNLPGLRCLAARALLGTMLVAGCGKQPAPPPPGEKPKNEVDLSRTTLSAEERDSLKIESRPPTVETTQERIELPAWVHVPPGREVTLAAPVPGYVRQRKETPVPGSAVKAGDGLLTLEPVLAPLDHIQLAALKRGIDSDVLKARESVAVAEAEVKRVTDLFEQKLRGKQDLEQAKARLAHSNADLEAATEKQKLFDAAGQDKGRVQLPSLTVAAPENGRLLALLVAPGQYVAAGTPLLSVADLSELWVRVPIPEQDFPRLDPKGEATVVVRGQSERLRAVPKGVVPQVEPDTHTVTALYEVKGKKDGLFAKDQLVTVHIPAGEKREQTVVPYSAVVFDAYGGAWVYVEKGHTYERRRVELGPSLGDSIVVHRSGLTKEDNVVVNGAQAIFSREFHKPPAADGAKQEVDDDD
jgi:membrane fusion protein, heavy metal efflux system